MDLNNFIFHQNILWFKVISTQIYAKIYDIYMIHNIPHSGLEDSEPVQYIFPGKQN